MAETIYLQNVRLSFPKLVEASSNKDFPDAAKKFSCDLIVSPTSPDYTKVRNEISKVAGEKWKDHASAVLSMIQADRRLRFYGNGAEKINGKTFKVYDGYEGNAYFTVSSNEDRPPQIIRPDGSVCDNPMERQVLARKLYGGCYVNAAIRPWTQDNAFGKGMRCELVAVQFAADGEPFGEAPPDLTGMFSATAAPAADAPPPWAM